MALILKNTTVSAITIKETGDTVPASGQLTIDPTAYDYYAKAETIAEMTADINSGDLVVNDGINDLTPAYAIYHLGYPNKALSQRFASDPERANGFVSKTTQEAIEEARDTPSKTSASIDDTWVFFRDGKSDGKWMRQFNNHVESSEKAPIIAPWSGKVLYLTMINKEDNSDGIVRIHKNGLIVFDWTITNKRWAKKTNGLETLTFNADDQISIFIDKISSDALEKTQIVMGVKYTSFEQEETGEASI